MQNDRRFDVQRFYDLLARAFADQLIRDVELCSTGDVWPKRGVYFFFENGELREDGTPRVVRIGTHGLKEGAKSTLWKRLAQHRGRAAEPGGNHRGSIFRLLIGGARQRSGFPHCPTWGVGKAPSRDIVEAERPLEAHVSEIIGKMKIGWIEIADPPGPESLRGYIERNAIALLSNYDKEPIDPPSSDWLGHASERALVRGSGLWNNRHVADAYDPEFLDALAALIDGTSPQVSAPNPPLQTETAEGKTLNRFVMQCAKSKQSDGWLVDADGRRIAFVARPDSAPSVEGASAQHPDGLDQNGIPWRQHVIDYNHRYSETGENPQGWHRAGDLYTHPAYARLAGLGPQGTTYILSAGWGLVTSDYLLPNYDVTYASGQNVPRCSIRQRSQSWQDFNMLPSDVQDPLIFIGGRRYLEAFAQASRTYAGPRIAYFNSVDETALPGVEMRRFETSTKTNWHYELVAALSANLPLATSVADPPSPRATATGLPPPAASGTRGRSESDQQNSKGRYGKYSALNRFLAEQPEQQQSVTLTFSELIDILQAPLPASSRKHAPVWWSNGGHAHSQSWLDAGFQKGAHRIAARDEESWIRFERMS